jgi:hypothetical protein
MIRKHRMITAATAAVTLAGGLATAVRSSASYTG